MTTDKAAIAALKNVSLFTGLDDKTIGRIAQQTKTYRFNDGESVIDEDASGRFGRLYVIVAGSAAALVHGASLATFGPGDYFGEMSVLDSSPRSASIVATSELVTLGLSAWNMRSLIREEPDISIHIIETLVARLRARNDALGD